MSHDRFYFRQLLAGRDFAVDDGLARQMVNFAYVIGDRATGEALLVDPAYGVRELVEIAPEDLELVFLWGHAATAPGAADATGRSRPRSWSRVLAENSTRGGVSQTWDEA